MIANIYEFHDHVPSKINCFAQAKFSPDENVRIMKNLATIYRRIDGEKQITRRSSRHLKKS